MLNHSGSFPKGVIPGCNTKNPRVCVCCLRAGPLSGTQCQQNAAPHVHRTAPDARRPTSRGFYVVIDDFSYNLVTTSNLGVAEQATCFHERGVGVFS